MQKHAPLPLRYFIKFIFYNTQNLVLGRLLTVSRLQLTLYIRATHVYAKIAWRGSFKLALNIKLQLLIFHHNNVFIFLPQKVITRILCTSLFIYQ